MAKKSGFNGEVLHCGAVRYQLSGSGVMKSTLLSVDDIYSTALPDIDIPASAARQATILSNFNQERMYLYFRTTKINEVINLSKLVIFIRPVATGYPTA